MQNKHFQDTGLTGNLHTTVRKTLLERLNTAMLVFHRTMQKFRHQAISAPPLILKLELRNKSKHLLTLKI